MSSVLFLIALVVAGGPHRVKGLQSCDFTGHIFTNITNLFESLFDCTYLTDKLNSSCVSSACPQLSQSGACPLTPTGNVNQTATNSLVDVINTCLEQEAVICDVTMAHIPLPFIRFSMAEIFVNLNVNGTCSFNPGSAWVDNLSAVRITSAGPSTSGGGSGLNLNLNAQNLHYYAHFTCIYSLTTPPLFLQVIQTFPSMLGYSHLNITNTVTFDKGDNLQVPTSVDFSVTFSNFTTLEGIDLPQALVDVFNEVMTSFLKKSTIASSPINFISLFINYALQVAQKTCF